MMNKKYLAMSFLFAGLTTVQPAVADVTAPQDYKALPCCSLCPAAKDQSNYTGDLLSDLWPLVEGKDGWIFRASTDLATEFGPSPETLAYLKIFAHKMEKRGVKILVSYLPSRGLMSDKYVTEKYDYELAKKGYSQALARYRDTGVEVPPLDEMVGNVQGDFFLKRDLHWSYIGAEATAKVIADYVLKHNPNIVSLPEKKFETIHKSNFLVGGNLHKGIHELCKQTYPEQYVGLYQTTPNTDLLSVEEEPQIVLIGTSFSASQTQPANFDGFLRQYINRDVLNVALSGGEEEGAWLEYLPSDTFQKKPPKLVIWELPSHQKIKNKSIFRQLIPLVDNGCENKTKITTKSMAINPTVATNELVFSKELLTTKARDIVIDMKLSDPNVHKMNVSVWYGNGTEEKLEIKQNKRANTGGRFVFSLAQDDLLGKQNFISMDLNNIESTEKKVDLKVDVCKLNDGDEKSKA